MTSFNLDVQRDNARIKVVGVGGAGGNAINRMIEAGLEGVEFIAVNTDLQDLKDNRAGVKIQIGSESTKGLGAGMKPEVGHDAMEGSREDVQAKLEGADMIFITAGMGGGTGTGAAPVIAQIAREMDILTVAVVTKPFNFEGPQRMRIANKGLEDLRQVADTLIVIPNQKLLAVADRKTTIIEAFHKADEVLYNATRDISTMILHPGIVNVDFADVCNIMKDSGEALMGSGFAEGEDRATKAAEMALHSPLLENIDITGAKGMLVNFTGSEIGIMETEEVMQYFRNALGEDADERTVWGFADDPSCGDTFRVTLVATGLKSSQAPAAVQQAAPEVPAQAPLQSAPARFIPNRFAPRDPSGYRVSSSHLDVSVAPTSLGMPQSAASDVNDGSGIRRPTTGMRAPISAAPEISSIATAIPAAPVGASVSRRRSTGSFMALPADDQLAEDMEETDIPSFMRLNR